MNGDAPGVWNSADTRSEEQIFDVKVLPQGDNLGGVGGQWLFGGIRKSISVQRLHVH